MRKYCELHAQEFIVINEPESTRFSLNTDATVSVEIAREIASALGDDQCGTEHLLFGIMSNAAGETAELQELFALDPLRVERAIQRLSEHRFTLDLPNDAPLPFSARAEKALLTLRADGSGPTGPFEMLHGMLRDDASGACQVLRELGVRPEEVRRLAAYGTRHLSDDQVANLMEALDRRTDESFRGWWGPKPEAPIETLAFGEGDAAMEVARSESAVVTVRTLAVTNDGFGLTVSIESLAPWLLPPVLQPSEVLIPGARPEHVSGPEVLEIELAFADGTTVSNRIPALRWTGTDPASAQLTYLGHRSEIVAYNDRRRNERRTITSDWWAWPLPEGGPVEVRVIWPAESIRGAASFDSAPLITAAHKLRADA